MTKAQLMKEMAKLESINDQLVAEITYVNQLMKMIGFSNGLATVKQTAEDMLHQELEKYEDGESEFLG